MKKLGYSSNSEINREGMRVCRNSSAGKKRELAALTYQLYQTKVIVEPIANSNLRHRAQTHHDGRILVGQDDEAEASGKERPRRVFKMDGWRARPHLWE